jgi:hypothetical protein
MHQVNLFGYGTRCHVGYRDQSEDPQRSITNDRQDCKDHYDNQQHQTSSIPCEYDEY